VLGSPLDGRADIYALGVMLYELLSGTQPFTGATALETALQRLAQPVPSLHSIWPELPEALDLVIERALERDPAKRYQRAGELAQAFARVVRAQKVARPAGLPSESQGPAGGQLTIPPTVNWFDEQITPSGKWQVVPPAGGKADLPRATVPSVFPPVDQSPTSLEGVDPFTWWSSAAQSAGSLPSTTGTFSTRSSLRLATVRRQGSRQPAQQERRRLVGLLVAGTAAGLLAVGTISIARLIGSAHPGGASGTAVPPGSATGSGSKTQPRPSVPSTSPTARTRPTAPLQPTAPPARAGTVIGSTALLPNSSLRFINPADGAASLLIHLASGRFVACERACTHQGIAVNYDPASKMLVCPAHGAIFDPQNHFSHVSGPGSGPLARVSIQMNGDGTITTP
jgi:Rieske Fe-S protein